jgi:hypothetical protein
VTEGLYKEETAMWPEHLVARKFLAVCFTLWVIQTAAGVAYGQTRGHHRRHREPFELDLPKPQERAYSTVEVVNITNYTPDANGLYDAEVLRYDPNANSWTSLYTCKVLDLNA